MNWKTGDQYPSEACEKEQAPIERALLELFAQAQDLAQQAERLKARLSTVTTPSAKLGGVNGVPTPPKLQSSMRDQIDMIKAKLDEAETTINTAINELEI